MVMHLSAIWQILQVAYNIN